MKKIRIRLKSNEENIRIHVKVKNGTSEKNGKENTAYKLMTVVFFLVAAIFLVFSIIDTIINWSEAAKDIFYYILKYILYFSIPIICGITTILIKRFKTSDKLSILGLIIALTTFIISIADNM